MENIKEEIENEIRNEVKEEVKDELKNELKDDIKTKMKSKIKNEIQDTQINNNEETSKYKTLYSEDDGLYRLIKDNLTTAEAVEIQGKIKNGEYGKRTGWYRKYDDKNKEKYSVWQLLVRKENMSSNEIAALRKSADILEKGDNKEMNEIDKKTIDSIKDDICQIKNNYENDKIFFVLIYGAMGGLYIAGGAMWLKYILHVDNHILSMYIMSTVILAFVALWLHCEWRKCNFF